MKLIVGLGNPGLQYSNTRHNVGFLTLDRLCDKLGIVLDKNRFKSNYGIYRHHGEKIIIAKPQTYMNLSGQAVCSLMRFYGIEIDDLLVIHDDLDLPLGKLRLRMQGSSGGQKGMGNIIELTGTQKISRIRIGISKNELIDSKDYVLGHFSPEERPVIDQALTRAAEAVIYSFDHRFDEVMTRFNS